MPKLKIDDIEYNTEELTERGLATLKSLQFLEIQIEKLRNEMAVYQTAQNAYAVTLKTEIEEHGIEPAAFQEQTNE